MADHPQVHAGVVPEEVRHGLQGYMGRLGQGIAVYPGADGGEIHRAAAVAAQARQMGLSKLFVLTTRSIHWFQERGFTPVDIDLLPESKKQMYNYQRRSKVLMADLA